MDPFKPFFLKNVAIECAHYDYKINLCKDWVKLNIVESIVECNRRQIIVSKCECGLSFIEPMIQMTNNRMDINQIVMFV